MSSPHRRISDFEQPSNGRAAEPRAAANEEVGGPGKRDAGQRAPVTIRAYPDGPLLVRGDVQLEGLDGPIEVRRSVIALCRCGRTKSAPLCDGSHRIRPADPPSEFTQ